MLTVLSLCRYGLEGIVPISEEDGFTFDTETEVISKGVRGVMKDKVIVVSFMKHTISTFTPLPQTTTITFADRLRVNLTMDFNAVPRPKLVFKLLEIVGKVCRRIWFLEKLL